MFFKLNSRKAIFMPILKTLANDRNDIKLADKLTFLLFSVANPAIRSNIFATKLFLQRQKRASFSRSFPTTKIVFCLQKFPLLSGLNEGLFQNTKPFQKNQN